MISISPDENYFMTGSVDGTACIWRPPETAEEINELIEDLENGRKDGGNKKEHPFKRNLVKTLQANSEMAISQCDCVSWSCRGRYAIVTFGGKDDDDSTIDRSIIYVWDQKKREVVREFGPRNSGMELVNFTFVLECHPKDENFFMSAGGGGKVNIWDIQKGESVQSFTEAGIYHRDSNMLDDIFDGKFSSCGKFFVVATVWGTLTIYSIYGKESYYATPVEQFFQYDKLPEATSSIYNERDAILVNYDRMRYPEQPPFPIIGERYLDKHMEPEEYETKYEDRYSKFSKEQKFNEDYVEEYGAFVILYNRDNNSNSESQSIEDDSSASVVSSRRRDRRSVYYDQYNDNFDNESDEDFIMDSNPDRVGTRRTVRRQPYNTDMPATSQRNDRERRRRERNRRRGDEDSNDDPYDYVMDSVVENEESEVASEDSYVEELINKKKPVVRNHNFASSRIEEAKDETSNEDEDLLRPSKPKTNNQYKGIFMSNRIVAEEDKDSMGNFKSFSHFLSHTNDENYDTTPNSTSSGYRIDIEDAIKLKKEDKAQFDCALCKKKRGEFSLIGPFKYFIGERVVDEMVYWFHRECLERNDIVN